MIKAHTEHNRSLIQATTKGLQTTPKIKTYFQKISVNVKIKKFVDSHKKTPTEKSPAALSLQKKSSPKKFSNHPKKIQSFNPKECMLENPPPVKNPQIPIKK